MDNKRTLLQSKLLEMLKWYDQFCRENNLTYYVLGGTMLGAVRHQGFIPWDDDVDVGMPRNDYEKLALIMQNRKLEKYILETPRSASKAYCYPYSKIYDTTTTLIEDSKITLTRGIFIDVFPLDGIGDSELEGKKNFKRIKRNYDFYLTRKCKIKKGRALYKNLAIILVGVIPERIIDNRRLRIKIDRLCSKIDYDKVKWCGNLLGSWRENEIMEKKIMGKPTEYQFEDMMVFGAEDFEGYLTNIYGNWKQPPPKEKQVTHHDFIYLDLEKSYWEGNS